MNTGQVFDRERIYEAVWGIDGDGNSDTVMEHIRKSGQSWRRIHFIATLKQFGGVVTNGTPKEYGFEEVIFLSIRMVHTAFSVVGLIGVFHMQHNKKRLSSRRYRNRVRWCYNTSGTADNSPTMRDNPADVFSMAILHYSPCQRLRGCRRLILSYQAERRPV